MSPNYKYIQNDSDLKDYCLALKNSSSIGIDTEFISEKTYSPLLCLIIIHAPIGTAIIDPFKINDFQPFLDVLLDEKIVKISHAGENDYKIFQHDFGVIPVNLFDTQIAAGIVYADYPISLEKLINRELKINLPKSSTVSDWTQRPLSKKQLDYAVYDVYYLIDLMEILAQKMTKLNKIDWLDDIQKNLISVKRFEPSLEELVSKHKLSFSPKESEILWIYRALKWRDDVAKTKNFNKSRIFKNKDIKDVYRLAKEGPNAWKNHRQFKFAKQIDWVKLNSFLKLPKTKYEALALSKIKSHHVIIHKTEGKEMMTDILYTSLKYLMHETISLSLVLNKALIRNIVYMVKDPNVLLPTWKRNILGEEASTLLLNAHNKKLKISTRGIIFE